MKASIAIMIIAGTTGLVAYLTTRRRNADAATQSTQSDHAEK